MRRRGIRGGKVMGTPTTNPPRPQAIDDYTGFKVDLDSLKKDWQGLLTQSPDSRNSQDFLRGIKDNMALPYSRPEVANQFIAEPLLAQDGVTFLMAENGSTVLYGEGVNPSASDL